MLPWSWLLVIIVVTWKISLSTAEIRVVCYYTNWSVYRPGTAKFNPQNINPYLCTHLIYAFGGFTKENSFKPFDKYQDIEKGGYAKFTGLKTYNKNLKTMLAVGGWNEGSSRFSPMVANPERRKEFVKNSIKFLRQNHFDGLDLDWEYPSFRDGGKPRDKDNYATLVQELREEYDREAQKTGRPRLLLTMAVPAGIEYINKGYDVPRLMKYLDWMNILSYDYHSAFEPAVNHHSPLYSLEEDSEYNYDAELNINHTINHYLEAGAERSKLVLGIPTYGRSYTLFNPDATEIGDPADGPGEMGDATRENGYLAYYEICEKIKDDAEWTVEQPDPKAMGPYAYKDDQWVGYDDENIVRRKSEFVAQRRLGGIMFWSIDNDDFRGACHGKPYPLIEAAKEALMAASGYTSDNVIPPPEKTIKSKSRTRTRPTTKKTLDDDEDAKPAQNSGGRQNANVSTRKRVRPKSQHKEEESVQISNKRRLRIHKKEQEEEEEEEEEDDDDDDINEGLKKRRLRVQKEHSNRRKQESKRRNSVTTTTNSPSLTRYQTPEPPTTPDPGGDFKCEDEGFFPHPRDCKKYFWCLSSGPSELGIVAHQFNCPSGLYFNKAADSCDYTQNVLCKKKAKAKGTTAASPAKASTTTTTTTTTTEAVAPKISFTTRRPPPKITAATSRTTRISSTTPEYQDEYEYEDEDVDADDIEDEDGPLDSEEDPRVIKELIDLIKKAGGIEELEKQLNLHEDGSVSVTSPGSTTPPSFSKTLYERVLSRAAGKNTERPLLKTKNSRGPQYDAKEDSNSSKRTRPQYTAISRQRPTTEKSEDEELEDDTEKKSDKQKSSRKSTQPEYKTISRHRSSTVSESEIETTTSSRLNAENDDTGKQVVTVQTPEYVTLRRKRPTTQEPTPKYATIRGRTSNYEEEVTIAESTTPRDPSTIPNAYKTSELSNNEYINTVEQQNITDTIEVSKILEGRVLPDQILNTGTEIILKSQDETTQFTVGSENNTENSLADNEQPPLSSSQRYRSSTVAIATDPSTTASTKVSDPISSRNALRSRLFQKAADSTDSLQINSTNVTESTTKRGSNRFSPQETNTRLKNSRRRLPYDKKGQDSPDDIADAEDDISNETDTPTVSDKISLINKQKIDGGSKQTATAQFRPRPFSPKRPTLSTEKPPDSNSNVNSNDNRTEKSSTERTTARRRGSAKFDYHDVSVSSGDGHYYDDGSYDLYNDQKAYDRRFRPDIAAEIADLSSLTSADISKPIDGSTGSRRVIPRHQRFNTKAPAVTEEPASTKTLPILHEASSEDNIKTSLRPLPLTRKLIPGQDSKRTLKPLAASVSEEPSTTKVPRFQKKNSVFLRPPTSTFRRTVNDKPVVNNSDSESTTATLAKPKIRNSFATIGRKRLEANHDNNTKEINSESQSSSENPVNRHNRKVIRRFRPTPSTSTPSIVTSITTTTTTTTSTTPATTTESQENDINSEINQTEQTTLSTTSTTTESSKEEKNITETDGRKQNVSILPIIIVTDDNDVRENITERGSSDNDEDVYRTSEEEEENIKLSETSIREKSEIHINALNDNSDKHRRRVVKKIRNEGKASQTKINYLQDNDKDVNLDSNFSPVTEYVPIVRTRKIIRKLPTTASTTESTITTSSSSEVPKGRTRKIIRRLRPTTTESSSTPYKASTTQNAVEATHVLKNTKAKAYGTKRIRPTFADKSKAEPVLEISQQTASEEIEQKGNEYPRYSFRRRQKINVNETENKQLTGNENVEGTTPKQEQKPLIRRINPQRKQVTFSGTTEKLSEASDEDKSTETGSDEETSPVRGRKRIRFASRNTTNISKNEDTTKNDGSEGTQTNQKPKQIRRIIPQRRQKNKSYGNKEDSSEITSIKSKETDGNDDNTEARIEKEKSSPIGINLQRRQKLNLFGNRKSSSTLSGGTKVESEKGLEAQSDRGINSTLSRTNTTQIEKADTSQFTENNFTSLDTNSQTSEIQTSTETTDISSTTTEDDESAETQTEGGEFTTINTITEDETLGDDFRSTTFATDISPTATFTDISTAQTEENELEDKEKAIETSTKPYRTRLNRIQKTTTTTETTTARENRFNIFSRFNSRRRDSLKSSEEKPVQVTSKADNNYDTSSETNNVTSTELNDVTSTELNNVTLTELNNATSPEANNATEVNYEHESSTKVNDEAEITTAVTNEEEDTTFDLDEITQQTTIDDDLTATDVSGFTTIETTDDNVSEEITEKSTTVKTTTPFYYRAKLSRPPFLLQRSRPVTESSRLTTSTKEYSRSTGYSRYSTRRKDKYKSRYDKKPTTESIEKEIVQEVDNKTNTVEDLLVNITEVANNQTTESNINTTDVTSSIPLTISTTAIDLQTTESPKNETLAESANSDELNSATTEIGTTTELYNETEFPGSIGRNDTVQNQSAPEATSISSAPVSVETTTLNSTDSIVVNTEEISSELMHNITDSILDAELLALIEQYEAEREALDTLQKTGYLNSTTFTSDNQTEYVNEIQNESTTSTTTEEQPELKETHKEENNSDLERVLIYNNTSEHDVVSTSTEDTVSSTTTRRIFVPRRRTTTTTESTSKEETPAEQSEESVENSREQQRAFVKTTSQRPKYKPRARPTERTLLYKQTTRRITINNEFDRSAPARSRFYIKPTTERAKIENNEEAILNATENPEAMEEEDYYDEDDEDEEYEDEGEEQEAGQVDEKVQTTERTYSNSFYRSNKPQYIPKRTNYRGSTERPSSIAPRRFGGARNSPVGKQTNTPAVHGNTDTKNSRNKLFNKSRKVNTPYPGISPSSTTASTVITTTTTTTTTTSTTTEATSTPIQKLTETTAQYQQENTIDTTTSTSTATEAADQLVTLHHIFSETESSTPTTTEIYSDVTGTSADKKLERLIEVNRIVEVSLKEGKFKHNSMVESEITLSPTLDRIGAINRVTVIKVVDPVNGTNVSEIISNLTHIPLKDADKLRLNVTLPTDDVNKQQSLINDIINAISPDLNTNAINISIINDLTVGNATSTTGDDKLTISNVENNLVSNGTKLEESNLITTNTEVSVVEEDSRPQEDPNLVQNSGEIIDYGHELEAIMPPHTQEEENLAKAQIRIDGKSVVNTFTPKPSFNTESSTIALEGLFQPDWNRLQREQSNGDEILQTQNANYVNIKILDQDSSSRRLKLDKDQLFIPIRLLKQDEYTTSRAEVIEITPEMNSGVIKIAPIAISVGNMHSVAQHRQSEHAEHTTVVFPVSVSKSDE